MWVSSSRGIALYPQNGGQAAVVDAWAVHGIWWICLALRRAKSGGARHPLECRPAVDKLRIDQKKMLKSPRSLFSSRHRNFCERESRTTENRTRGSSKFLSAAFYPILPIQSFLRRDCSRLTRFSSEVADETRRERHVSLAREGWLGYFHAGPFFPAGVNTLLQKLEHFRKFQYLVMETSCRILRQMRT